jgi:Flp pilus assembly protein TadD
MRACLVGSIILVAMCTSSAADNPAKDLTIATGVESYRSGNYARAESLFVQITTHTPSSAEAWYRLGLSRYRLKKHAGAEKALMQALNIAPRDPRLYNALGLTYMAQADPTQAVANYNAALGIRPKYLRARYNLGIAYNQQGKTSLAISAFERAVADSSEFTGARYALAVMLKKARRYDDAAVQLLAMISIDTTNSRPHMELGFIESERRRFAEAERHFRRALRLNPRDARARYGLGVAYALQGHWVMAQGQCDSLKSVNGALHKRLRRIINP